MSDRPNRPGRPPTARIQLVVRAGCHLCEPARAVVGAVAREAGVAVVEVDVDADPVLFDAYNELVPVVLVDGVPQGHWRIDAGRVRAALA